MAPYETNRELETQQMEPYHANQWASQAQMERSRLYQESHAKDCFEIEELRRICREESERARQLRTDELSAQKKGESLHNQLFSQIQEWQDKVNALN